MLDSIYYRKQSGCENQLSSSVTSVRLNPKLTLWVVQYQHDLLPYNCRKEKGAFLSFIFDAILSMLLKIHHAFLFGHVVLIQTMLFSIYDISLISSLGTTLDTGACRQEYHFRTKSATIIGRDKVLVSMIISIFFSTT